jgi:hypothetical protein
MIYASVAKWAMLPILIGHHGAPKQLSHKLTASTKRLGQNVVEGLNVEPGNSLLDSNRIMYLRPTKVSIHQRPKPPHDRRTTRPLSAIRDRAVCLLSKSVVARCVGVSEVVLIDWTVWQLS